MDITEQLTHESRIALAAAAEITRLRAEVEALKAENERQFTALNDWLYANGPNGWIDLLRHELAAMTTEVEALRADAERYRWLRDGSNPPWVMQMLERYADNGSDFDAEVDAAIDLTTNQAVDAMDVLRARRALEGE